MTTAGKSCHKYLLRFEAHKKRLVTKLIITITMNNYIIPQVTKKQVDNFKPGMMPPRFQLTAEYTGNKRKVPSIRRCMKLTGAGEHFTDIVITLPPPGMHLYLLCTEAMQSIVILHQITHGTSRVQGNLRHFSSNSRELVPCLRDWLTGHNPQIGDTISLSNRESVPKV